MNTLGLNFVMPILGVFFTLVLLVTIIIVIGNLVKAKIITENKKTHQELKEQICQLQEEVQKNKEYLENISQKVDSINQILKDV